MVLLHAWWQKNYSQAHRRNSGVVCGKLLSAEWHFITHSCVRLVVDKLIEGLDVNGYTTEYVLSSSM